MHDLFTSMESMKEKIHTSGKKSILRKDGDGIDEQYRDYQCGVRRRMDLGSENTKRILTIEKITQPE